MPYVKDRGGLCPLCSRRAHVLEGHHVCYDPPRKIRICHSCHFLIHHYTGRIDIGKRLLLEQLKGKDCKD